MGNESVEEAIKAHWHNAPVNIEQIIRDSGVRLDKKANLARDIAGQLRRLDNGGFEISVNVNDHYYRQRFTMAHELGHYYLHKSLVGQGTDDNAMYRSAAGGNFYNTAIQKRHEHEANTFAAFVLMPDHLVQRLIQEAGSAEGLHKKLQVSEPALKIRLKSLGLHFR